MEYRFNSYGHESILATHNSTLEFTKGKDVTRNGDCIVGVNSDFSLPRLREVLKGKVKVRLVMECDGRVFEINAAVNSKFDDKNELVVRKSDFASERTLGVRCDKAAADIPRGFVKLLQKSGRKIQVRVITQ